MTMDQVAAIAVPTGRPYAFIDSSDLPKDWSSRDTWFVDDADLTDGVGGAEGVQEDGLFKPREGEAA
ncbi:hypothetical protein [Neorhizobium galegae]|uniref:hypothetical protein n=1 Tax=Neorhizobium galegae TaxID=399 RepID=UPI00210616FF|nr:hypothetical protein [Neorhizobium galegae]MCQ1850375.1 hypothetical protein [Neorhizobium galegae]